ncbi:LytTR family DNA-binding domain-containing protein [Pseudonocardia bannensis]|uniref:LytTR family transcriptional regulator n=1 Tax=Pseudonocardia bannensis TaxID=630973 RepID=A0A848DDA9_9PSEU|nr:LytTR family DNA-binding domain-containing protein [Pseudonocardia bannensis]NMH90552.1 LytTR family transcriptional regulator [Pseudonocardia bannensis]
MTDQPVAVLNISFWRQDPSRAISSGLERAVAPLRSLLLERAVRDGADLVKAFLEAERKATADDAVVAVDAGGNVVAANHRARTLEDRLPAIPALEPGERWRAASPRLREIAAEAGLRATKEPSWIGTGRLDLLSIETTFEFRPVTSDNGFIGVLLVSTDSPQGEPVHVPAEVMEGARNRIVGICENRLIILTPNEIRYAEADRHAVWLVTDRGRVRAASRGIDNVERELAPFGFLRVHRGYLVNVQRIREVDQGFCKGTLTVSTQHHGREVIPVARRHVPRLRTVLSI